LKKLPFKTLQLFVKKWIEPFPIFSHLVLPDKSFLSPQALLGNIFQMLYWYDALYPFLSAQVRIDCIHAFHG